MLQSEPPSAYTNTPLGILPSSIASGKDPTLTLSKCYYAILFYILNFKCFTILSTLVIIIIRSACGNRKIRDRSLAVVLEIWEQFPRKSLR